MFSFPQQVGGATAAAAAPLFDYTWSSVQWIYYQEKLIPKQGPL